jgi:hypothetical protein
VFSDWADVLELVAHAAKANAIPYLQVKGKSNLGHMLAIFQGRAAVPTPPPPPPSSASLQPALTVQGVRRSGRNGSGRGGGTRGARGGRRGDAFSRGGRLAGVGSRGLSDGETPRVLLLPLALGGNGLNLTEAQHVVIVEPLMDPGVEAQVRAMASRTGRGYESQSRKSAVESFVARTRTGFQNFQNRTGCLSAQAVTLRGAWCW